MVAVLAIVSLLNDAALSEGGTPRMLHGETTVRMVGERVLVRVGTQKTTAECNFVFENDGPACTVKVGFPDHGFGAADPEEELDPEARKHPPKESPMSGFASWVDGKRVQTRLERGKDAGEYWHTKTVRFRGHGRTMVRDVYTLNESGAIVMLKDKSGSASYAGYVVSTGASWKGKIGRSEIEFELPSGIRNVTPQKQVASEDRRQFTVAGFAPGTVVYRGMSTPAVSGRRLRFVRTNWKPTSADDIELWFAFKSLGGN